MPGCVPYIIYSRIDVRNLIFNIYSNTGELILEYTKQNCDSLSLKTLDDIYYTAKEFYNKKPSEEKQNPKIKQIKLEGVYVQR